MKIKNKDFLYLISAIIAFGSFIFGYSLVCISMMADKIQLEHNLSGREFDWQLSFITTLMPLGAFIGM
jgi:heme/copper-type cytochrome/quinol oxidase subunit 3